jgi:hypothetical protein
LKTDLPYDAQEELIANVIKQCLERFLPFQGIEIVLTYRLPIGSVGKSELEKISVYDKQCILSKTKICKVELRRNAPGGYIERVLLEVTHIFDDVRITSFNFLYDDLTI